MATPAGLNGQRAGLTLAVPAAWRLLLVGLPLGTGAALVAFIVLEIPMTAAGVAFAMAGLGVWAIVFPRLPADGRRYVWRRVRFGVIAGVPAVLAYDATRFGMVAVASMSFEPFHAIQLFGHALLGNGAPAAEATIAGIAFHLANGIGFAIAFALIFSRPTPLLGIGWALVLEGAMLLLYPGWLGVSLVSELVPVSVAGHLAYGAALGAGVRRLEGQP